MRIMRVKRFSFVKITLEMASSKSALRKEAAFRKSQTAAAINRRQERNELRSPNKGMIREETPVDRSHAKMIRLICFAEKTFVMQGSPVLS
jgi:hypothetical protein